MAQTLRPNANFLFTNPTILLDFLDVALWIQEMQCISFAQTHFNGHNFCKPFSSFSYFFFLPKIKFFWLYRPFILPLLMHSWTYAAVFFLTRIVFKVSQNNKKQLLLKVVVQKHVFFFIKPEFFVRNNKQM